MLSVGSFQHLPNVGAVEYLCKEILPRLDPSLVAEHPVYIVGNALNETVRGFAKGLPDVRMVGWVPSVEPYFAHARISVVPLLYGAGTKRKLIQALMAGTPTVSTRIGVEGLNLQDERHVLVADTPARFAESITRLLTDEPLWAQMADQGRSLISETHNLAEAKRRFFEAIEDVLGKIPKTRATHAVTEGELTKVMAPPSYQQLSLRLREAVRETVPPDATVLVISKGDPELVKLDKRRVWHFPRNKNGCYAGYYPADGNTAVEHLEDLRYKGAEYLVIPNVALWWLDFYPEFKQHLESQYTELARYQDVCLIYALRHPLQGDDVRTNKLTVDLANRANGVARATSNRSRSSEHTTAVVEPAIRVRHPVRTTQDAMDNDAHPRLIAFYLPQFHPIPENDEWWGEGFTEWRNVAKADPLFPGHYQPHIPGDLGFYDLRCPETREHQSELAKEYGIHGFCYYHYWFEGKRLLERPFNEILSAGKPDFPFCLCWANDPWSRKWDGRTQDLLMPQSYSPEDDLAHIRCLLPALGDPRAIHVDGRPLFLVYRAKHLPDAQRTMDTWRDEAGKAGLKGLYLMAVETAWDLGWDATEVGFDAKVLFQPQFGRLITSATRMPIIDKDNLQVYDYATTWPILAQPESVSYRRYETVCPSWDNTARVRESAVVLHECEPAEYGKWLHDALIRAQAFPESEQLVFLNAWNEWAEGCHLEPDLRHGRSYLEETRRVLRLPLLRQLALR